MRRSALAAPLLGAALVVTGCATERTLRVQASWTGEACAAEIEGRRIAIRDLPAVARPWRGREAHVGGDVDTPYRCIGSVIYALQRAGLRRIGFVSEPAPRPER